MKKFCAILIALCAFTPVGFSQQVLGGLVYQTAKFGGRVVPIFGIDPLDPTFSVSGDNLALYARRSPIRGAGYWAQLWIGPSGATEAGLNPVEGTLVNFHDHISAIQGNSGLKIPGTLGGEIHTFQLRVWAGTALTGETIASWEEVLGNPNVPRGKSGLVRLTLGNIDAANKPHIPPNLSAFLEGFGLHIIPEPSLVGVGAMGLCIAALWRRSKIL